MNQQPTEDDRHGNNSANTWTKQNKINGVSLSSIKIKIKITKSYTITKFDWFLRYEGNELVITLISSAPNRAREDTDMEEPLISGTLIFFEIENSRLPIGVADSFCLWGFPHFLFHLGYGKKIEANWEIEGEISWVIISIWEQQALRTPSIHLQEPKLASKKFDRRLMFLIITRLLFMAHWLVRRSLILEVRNFFLRKNNSWVLMILRFYASFT